MKKDQGSDHSNSDNEKAEDGSFTFEGEDFEITVEQHSLQDKMFRL